MVLVQIDRFSIFFLWSNLRQENVFYDILEQENAFLGYKNIKFEKLKNSDFSKRASPWFWPKIGNFSTFFLLGNLGQENVFYGILEQQNIFLGYKNIKFKKSKNWGFSMVLSKNGHFPIFFIRQSRPGKCV